MTLSHAASQTSVQEQNTSTESQQKIDAKKILTDSVIDHWTSICVSIPSAEHDMVVFVNDSGAKDPKGR